MKKTAKEKIILVHYLDIEGLPQGQVDELIEKTEDSLNFQEDEVLAYYIPVEGGGNRVECINPLIVTRKEYKKAKIILDELKRKLEEDEI